MTLTKEDIVTLIQVLQNTQTQNLQTAQKLITLSGKLADILKGLQNVDGG